MGNSDKHTSNTRKDIVFETRGARENREEREALRERALREIPPLREAVDRNLADLRRIAGTGR